MSEETPAPDAPQHPLEAIRAAIAKADAIVQQDRTQFAKAVEAFDAAIAQLNTPEIEDSDAKRHLLGWAEMGKGNALANSDSVEGFAASQPCYTKSLEHFESIEEPSPANQADIAAVWGNIGHSQSRSPDPKVAAQAAESFTKSIALIEKLPWQDNPRFRHQLAATHLNLANVQVRGGDPKKPSPEAIATFDKAIEILGDLKATDAAIGMLLASIHAGIGRALMWSEVEGDAEKAVAAFEQAITVIAKVDEKKDPRLAIEMASAHANRASILCRFTPSQETIQNTLESGEFALKLAGPNEQTHLVAAEITLSARRSVCHSFGILIGNQTPEIKTEMHNRATDLLEDGLKVIAHWEAQGATGMRQSAQHLFHLGCAFYCTQQPHFLPEFIGEHLAAESPDPVMRNSAEKTTAEALQRLEKAEAADSELADTLRKLHATLAKP